MPEPGHARISLRRQWGLLRPSRSTASYRPRAETLDALALKEAMDRQYTARPYYGVPRMTEHLRRAAQ